MLDLILRDAQIIDGTGAPRQRGDLGVRDGRIVSLGDVDESATRTIDVGGAVVAPGFIDVHTHYDAQVFWDPALTPSSLHGVTTVLGGNCGFSVAPLSGAAAEYLMTMLARVEGMPLASLETGVPWDWSSTAEYLDRLESRVGLNVGFLVGHSALRRVVMGDAAKERAAMPDELDAMKQLLRAGLAAGGLGFSTSLAESHNDAAGDPVPSRCASYDEIVELAAICGEFPGTALEMVPIAGMGGFPDDVQALMIELTVRSGRPLNWNTVNVRASNGDEIAEKLALSDRAAAAGGKIVGLFTPMPIDLRLNLATGFVLDMLPGWDKLMALPAPEKLELLRAPEGRRMLRERGEAGGSRWTKWGEYTIHGCFTPETKQYEGRLVSDLAHELGKDPYDALIDIVVTDGLRTTFGLPPTGAGPADWKARGPIFRDERVVVGASDAGAHLDMIDTFRYPTDVLATCVREYQLLSTEEAVHVMTQVPAELSGLRDRGVLREGAWADIVVFDEDTVGSAELETRADVPGGSSRLFASSVGIDLVLVNGAPLVDHGALTGRLPGRVLRSGRDTATPTLDLPSEKGATP